MKPKYGISQETPIKTFKVHREDEPAVLQGVTEQIALQVAKALNDELKIMSVTEKELDSMLRAIALETMKDFNVAEFKKTHASLYKLIFKTIHRLIHRRR